METHPSAEEWPQHPSDRKLLAVVHMDVVGYSKLIAIDDVGTVARMTAIRKEIIELEAQRSGGRVIQVVGDSIMIVFESIDRAVESALRIQSAVPVADGQRASGDELRFRIGVNIGDVISDSSGLHGDGINVAARLQQACPVGAVCVSRSVYEHLQDGVRRRFERLGALKLKNIAQPVEAFISAVSGAPVAQPKLAGSEDPVAETVLTTYIRSNDFLAAGDVRRFPALLERSKQAVWLVGTTFFITVGQYRALILQKLAQGVPIHFLILRPEGQVLGSMATLLGVTRAELKLDCMSGIKVLQRTLADANRQGHGELLRIRLLGEPFQTRFYMFDPEAPDGSTFFVPQVGGTNSQTIPGFLVQNRQAPWLASYFAAVRSAWDGPRSVPMPT